MFESKRGSSTILQILKVLYATVGSQDMLNGNPSSKLKVDFSHVQFGLINLGEKGGSAVRLLPVDIA